VLVLRQFRDRYLLGNMPGAAFVKLYYKLSPPVASYIASRPLLKKVVRTGLAPAVAFAGVSLVTTPAEKAVIWALFSLVFLGSLTMLGRKRARETHRGNAD